MLKCQIVTESYPTIIAYNYMMQGMHNVQLVWILNISTLNQNFKFPTWHKKNPE